MAPKPLSPNLWEINENTGCWEWVRGKSSDGYGSIRFLGKHTRAHRLMYQNQIGPIPKGMFICHSCDNRSCVNPNHLFPGTHQDNMDDMMSKGRSAGGAVNPPKGSLHYASKITESDVLEIRRLSSTVKQADLGKRFGLTPNYIWSIINRRTWRHI